MKAKRTWFGLALAILAALAVGGLVAPPGGADEHKLKEVKDGEVTQQGEIDRPGEEEPVSPESVTKVGETITIVSKTFTPPGKMAFKEFPSPNPWHFVDIETDPDAPPGSADTDTASAINISVEGVPETAGDWPLKGEGNLRPTAGGSGGQGTAAFHWSAKMAREKTYYFLWGYLSTLGLIWQEAEIAAIEPVIEKLRGMGYEVYDDGPDYDQSRIDRAFTSEEVTQHPKRVILDRNTTQEDLVAYLQRGTARGVLWSGHGYMEPYPGCPDADLLKFESRVWTARNGNPAETGEKTFVRMWEGLIRNRQECPMNFLVMHSCATGGLGGDYWDAPWESTPMNLRRTV